MPVAPPKDEVLYMGNLNPSVKEDTLKKFFFSKGDMFVINVDIKSGFAFVTVRGSDNIPMTRDRVLDKLMYLNGLELEGRTVTIQISKVHQRHIVINANACVQNNTHKHIHTN